MSRYKLISIEKVSAPSGANNKPWYCFVIENNNNSMTGYRTGTEKEVRKIALESVKNLNEKYYTQHPVKHYQNPVDYLYTDYL